ncbi:hypothetical protein AB0L70_39880 [Kribbella sp. NPDC051952]|uniref:hypothetical protein n=1 Tax=Kribbella sp. NPDC051952 TaxID=3154851 RepID=UPI0034142625
MWVARLLPWVVAVGVATGAAALPSVAAGNEAGPEVSLSGSGGGQLGPEWKPYDGDPVRFEIDARATDPLHPSGTFHVVHREPDGRLLAEFSGRITSLSVVDEVAMATGTIDVADHPGIPMELVGKPVSFTVYDGGKQDRIGWMWGFFGAPVRPLQGTAPSFALTDGGFQVRDGRHRGPSSPQQAGPKVAVTAANDTGTTVAAVLGGPDRSPGGTLRLELAAHVPAGGDPTQVQGGFRFTSKGARIDGRLTCLATGGPVAITTGVVTSSTDPARVGQPVSFSLKDGKIDRVGWSAGVSEVADCRSVVPSYAPQWGGVVVGKSGRLTLADLR